MNGETQALDAGPYRTAAIPPEPAPPPRPSWWRRLRCLLRFHHVRLVAVDEAKRLRFMRWKAENARLLRYRPPDVWFSFKGIEIDACCEAAATYSVCLALAQQADAVIADRVAWMRRLCAACAGTWKWTASLAADDIMSSMCPACLKALGLAREEGVDQALREAAAAESGPDLVGGQPAERLLALEDRQPEGVLGGELLRHGDDVRTEARGPQSDGGRKP